MMEPKILVVIVSYNSMKWAQLCYSSLLDSTLKCDVLTIDNGSSDGTQQYVRDTFPKVQLVENNRNLGFGAACNIGFRKALDEGYDYVYLMNQDAYLLPDTLEKLVTVSHSHPEYGILSPMQMKADAMHLDNRFLTLALGSNAGDEGSLIEDLSFGRCGDVYDVCFAQAAHWLVTSDCIQRVGGFSPTFYHYGEDNNYIHRALAKNVKVGVVPCAKAVHDRENEVWSKEKREYIDYYVVPLIRFSNPSDNRPFTKTLIKMMLKSVIKGNKAAFDMSVRMFKMRNIIIANKKKSLEDKAFI